MAQAVAQTIGAIAATAVKASIRTQPPTPILSTGTVSKVQPNRTAGRNATSAIRGHSKDAALLPRPKNQYFE